MDGRCVTIEAGGGAGEGAALRGGWFWLPGGFVGLAAVLFGRSVGGDSADGCMGGRMLCKWAMQTKPPPRGVSNNYST